MLSRPRRSTRSSYADWSLFNPSSHKTAASSRRNVHRRIRTSGSEGAAPGPSPVTHIAIDEDPLSQVEYRSIFVWSRKIRPRVLLSRNSDSPAESRRGSDAAVANRQALERAAHHLPSTASTDNGST